MDRHDINATLIGCTAVDEEGRRLGRVIAIIHRRDGADVLIERRRWLRRSATIRVDGQLLERLTPTAVTVSDQPFEETAGTVRVTLAGMRIR